MKSFQARAIRLCGWATLMVVSISVVEMAQLILDVHVLPGLMLSLGVALLVSFVAFLVANAPRVEIAESICWSSVAVIAVLLALHVYQAGIASIGILDVALAFGALGLLGELCRGVVARRRALSAA